MDFDDQGFPRPQTPVPPEPPFPVAPPPSLLGRFIRLFTSPRTAWTLPLGHRVWIAALIVIADMQLAQGWLLRDLVVEQMTTSMSQNERLTEEQRELILERTARAFSSFGSYLPQGVIGVLWTIGVGFLIPALIYLLGLNFGLGGRAAFSDILAVTAFSGLVTVVRDLIRVPLMLSRESLYVFVSPAALVDPENRALLAALDRFDVFALYRLLLLAVGFSVIAGLRTSRTALLVLLV